MRSEGRYLLSIESAIAGGSIALFDSSELIAARSGDGSVSRAEDLLPNIVSMLEEAGIAKNELFRVAVSLGPGSYTGLRIGIATVIGLKRGLDIEYVGLPLFDAIAAEYPDSAIAVPMGKSDVCFAVPGSQPEPVVVGLQMFVESTRENKYRRILVHPALTADLQGLPGIETLDRDLATYVGRAALSLPPSSRLDPIYVQNPRFG